MSYHFTEEQKTRFVEAMRTAMAIPFIDGIEDFVVESILAHVLRISIPDPFFETRSKRLFDVVDKQRSVGWSVKSVQYSFAPGSRIELVIQRADIFKKAQELGFPPLSKSSDPQLLGKALLKHWEQKVLNDASDQRVESKRVFILLKQKNSFQYATLEENLRLYESSELEWRWTDSTKTGLQGVLRSDQSCVYRWYPNQKQMFEGFWIPADIEIVNITPVRLKTDQVVSAIIPRLASRP